MKFIVVIIIILNGFLVGVAQETNQETIKLDTMKTEFLGLRTVVYKVGNLNEAKEWYSKAFEVEPYFDEPFYVGFNIGGYELGLLPEENPVTDKTEGVVAYWGVENVQKRFEKLIELGAKVHEEPHDVGPIVASVKDPWGNIIGIIYNPHFKLPQE
jgi:lactoylglutathione lyase